MKPKTLTILLFIFLLLLPLASAISITNNLQYNTSATKVNISYDQLNRIIQKNFTGERYNYTYDQRNGTLYNITFSNGTYTYVYDNKYRVQTESRVIDGIVFNKSVVYDASDRVIRNNFSSGEMLNYTYTNQSGLDTIAGYINQTAHAVNNQPANRTYNNSLHTIFMYNETTLRVTSIETGTVADIDLLQNLTYSYDNSSNILKITDNANTMTYVMLYDDLNRVTYANKTGTSLAKEYEYNYSYDSISNLLNISGASANITFIYTDTPVHAPKTITTMNYAPTQSTPILNSSNGRNLTIENLTVYTVDTYDKNFDNVKNIITWYRNSTSLLLLNVPFEGNSTVNSTRDYSGFNHTVNVWNATWFKDQGYDEFGAYNFSTAGNRTFLNVSHSQVFNVSRYTVEAWAYPHSSTTGVIVGKTNASFPTTQWQLSWLGSNTYRCAANNAIGVVNVDGTSSAGLLRSWSHVACVYNGTNLLLYVNGRLENNVQINLIRNNDANIVIGGRDEQNVFFNGIIDDVKIWNASLSWEQINHSYMNRTALLDQTMTEEADIWQVNVTPNDGYEDGATLFSNPLKIRSSPAQDDVILNSTYETNLTTENLSVHNISTFDNQNDQIKNIVTWYRNNTPLLVFYSPAEGGSNTTATKDYGGYNMSINVVNANWGNRSGYDGFGAYNFSKNDPNNKTYLNVSHHQGFNLSSWTMMAWVYPHSTDPAGGVAVGKFQQWTLAYLVNNRYRCGVFNPTLTFFSADSRSSAQFVKRWSHVACVFNGTNLTIYVNGNYENFVNVDGGGFINSSELQIGARNTDQFFNGSVDDVQIWNGTVSWQQINNSFNNKTREMHWTMTVADETWNATITPNDRTQDGEIRTSKALLVRRMIELLFGSGGERMMNSISYNATITIANQPLMNLSNENYTVVLGWSVMAK